MAKVLMIHPKYPFGDAFTMFSDTWPAFSGAGLVCPLLAGGLSLASVSITTFFGGGTPPLLTGYKGAVGGVTPKIWVGAGMSAAMWNAEQNLGTGGNFTASVVGAALE